MMVLYFWFLKRSVTLVLLEIHLLTVNVLTITAYLAMADIMNKSLCAPCIPLWVEGESIFVVQHYQTSLTLTGFIQVLGLRFYVFQGPVKNLGVILCDLC